MGNLIKMEKLIEFLKENLNPRHDAEVYAQAVVQNATSDLQEIRGIHSITGNPITFELSDFGIEI